VSWVVKALSWPPFLAMILENSPGAIDLYQWAPSWPLCLVFGHETEGVAGEVAGRIETHVRIPMLGRKRSLNVASAAAVVLYELLRRRIEGESLVVPSP